MAAITATLAAELKVAERQVAAAVELLDGGATVPFVARYRKEATGGLDDAQLRDLEERLGLPARPGGAAGGDPRRRSRRRASSMPASGAHPRRGDARPARRPLPSVQGQAPHQGSDRPRGGLGPLAEALLVRPGGDPAAAAGAFVDAAKGVADVDAALEGARSILIERFSEDPDLTGGLREAGWRRGRIVSSVKPGKEAAGEKFADYFSFTEP